MEEAAEYRKVVLEAWSYATDSATHHPRSNNLPEAAAVAIFEKVLPPHHFWAERRGTVAPDPPSDAQLWKVNDLGGDKLAARVMGKRLTSAYINRLQGNVEGDAPSAPPRPVATPSTAMVAAPPVENPFKSSRPIPDEAVPATHIPPPPTAEPAETTTPPPAPAPATPSAGGRAATAEAKRVLAEKRGSTSEAPRRAVTTPPSPSSASAPAGAGASKSAPTSTEGPCEKCGTKDLNTGKWNTDPRKDPARIAEFSRQNFDGKVYCLSCQKVERVKRKVKT